MLETEREHLWKALNDAKEEFRQALIASEGHLSDEKYFYYRGKFHHALREWEEYLHKMEGESLA